MIFFLVVHRSLCCSDAKYFLPLSITHTYIYTHTTHPPIHNTIQYNILLIQHYPLRYVVDVDASALKAAGAARVSTKPGLIERAPGLIERAPASHATTASSPATAHSATQTQHGGGVGGQHGGGKDLPIVIVGRYDVDHRVHTLIIVHFTKNEPYPHPPIPIYTHNHPPPYPHTQWTSGVICCIDPC